MNNEGFCEFQKVESFTSCHQTLKEYFTTLSVVTRLIKAEKEYRKIDRQMDRYIDRQIDGWIDRQIDGWIDGLID